jgi:hypothetical protein
VVVPLTAQTGDVVLFPLTTRDPGADRLAVKVPETERRRLRLRGAGPSWLLLDEGNRDVLPGSYHVEPIAHDPPTYVYGTFSQAFMRVVLQTSAAALRARRMRLVQRET